MHALRRRAAPMMSAGACTGSAGGGNGGQLASQTASQPGTGMDTGTGTDTGKGKGKTAGAGADAGALAAQAQAEGFGAALSALGDCVDVAENTIGNIIAAVGTGDALAQSVRNSRSRDVDVRQLLRRALLISSKGSVGIGSTSIGSIGGDAGLRVVRRPSPSRAKGGDSGDSEAQSAGSELRVQVTVDDTVPAMVPLRAEQAILRMIINLLSNAFKYTPPAQGRVHVTVALRDHGIDAACRVLRVEVADSGPGVDDADKQAVFGMRRFITSVTQLIQLPCHVA
eukprot:g5949.t1